MASVMQQYPVIEPLLTDSNKRRQERREGHEEGGGAEGNRGGKFMGR